MRIMLKLDEKLNIMLIEANDWFVTKGLASLK